MTTGTVATLRRYGARSASNRCRLESWFDEALERVAENQGGEIASASANGASYSKLAGGLTTVQWMNALDRALNMLDTGVKYTGRSYGNIN